jgi:glycosyltransferase involved in cell wall biosynthesis
MKIILILSSLNGGGSERVMVTLANKFAQDGYLVDLVIIRNVGCYAGELDSRVSIVDLNSLKALHSIIPLSNYIKGLQRVKDCCILSSMRHINLLSIASKIIARSSVRLVIREANTYSVITKNTKSFKSILIDLFAKFLYSKADAIIAPSEGVANDLVKLNSSLSPRVNIIYNPVDIDTIYKSSKESVDFGFDTSKTSVVLAVGSLIQQKNFRMLVQAFSKVVKTTDSVLVILGEGKEFNDLLKLSKDLGISDKVIMPGFVRNPFAYMSKAKVFVLSSIYEGLPNVLLQAASLGVPIVATDCPSGPKEILENGKWGKLVAINDVDKMASAIQDGCHDKLLPIPKELVNSKYSVHNIGAQYIDLLGVNFR